MRTQSSNRVRALREQRGLSQAALGLAARLTRQSVSAIEAGRATPSVDVALRIAKALGCTVEALFAEVPEVYVRAVPFEGSPHEGRVSMAQIGGRWVSYPLAGDGIRVYADGIEGGQGIEPFGSLSAAQENVVMVGCAAALGLVADRLNARQGLGRFLWVSGSSTRALRALSERQAHIAGVHLVDDRTGEANLPDVRKHPLPDGAALITLARWEAGLVVAAGNPKKLKSPSDLTQRGLRFVVREAGSGARRLLEQSLRAAGGEVLGGALEAAGHLEVARAVALGAADVGVATRDVAIAYGLGFVPLTEERYDLVVPLPFLTDPRLVRLFDCLTASPLRRELAALGYDTRDCGQQAAEVTP